MEKVQATIIIKPYQRSITLELDSDTTMKQIHECLCDIGELQGHISECTFYSERHQSYKKPQDIVGSLYRIQTIILEKSDLAQRIFVDIQILIQGKAVQYIQVELDSTTSIAEIFQFINDSMCFTENTNNWTCFSKDQGLFYEHDEILGSQLKRQTLIIDVQEYNNQPQVSPIQSINLNNQQEIYFCQIHTHCPLQFICAEKHNCQRRLCAECQQDQIHKELQVSKFLPLNQFKERLKAQAEMTLKNKNNCQDLKKKTKNIKTKLLEIMNSLEISLEKAIQQYNDSFKTATDILQNLNSQSILDNSNSVLQEMVQLYQENMIKKQEFVNNINFKTIEQHLDNVCSIVDQFLQQITNLDFVVIPQHQWYNLNQISQINYDPPQIIYQNLDLCNLSPQLESYGKYLISTSSVKVEVHNKFQLIDTLCLIPKPQFTQRQISSMVFKRLSLQNKQIFSDIQKWFCFSEAKKQEIKDIDEPLHQFIVQDNIKINLMF